MSSTMPQVSWISTEHFKSRFQANVAALATRYPQMAKMLAEWVSSRNYFIHVVGDQVVLGEDSSGSIKSLPVILSPAAAIATMDGMFTEGKFTVAMIAGEDLGWLWNGLYKRQVSVASLPGFRPPLFFLMRDIERLRIILHIQDWRDLLADPRVRLFVGDDCVPQFHQSLRDDVRCPWPTLWVTVTPDIWPTGYSIESIFTGSRAAQDAEVARLGERQKARSARNTPQIIASRFASGRPLKVLGITSRYTSFLQHSMRDWLDAFERLGHTIRLEIEHADHELCNNLAVAKTCDEFEPDLIVSIDHYRKSLFGIADDVPVVMWIQDALPDLFNAAAGAAQGPYDFAMSPDPLKMVHEFGYPAERMISALIGVNENRFKSPAGHGTTPTRYACDVSFVSHASTSAEALLQKYLVQYNSEFATRFLTDLFARLKQIYDDGKMVTNPIILRRLAEQSKLETKVTIADDQMKLVDYIFGQQINNAFFRHQSLQWLADAGVNLHLYGNGWDQHPTLARWARGPADNQTQLASIYRSSKINLHISPFGAVHQRVMEGLVSGGFFMLRYCAGDKTERLFKPIWEFCKSRSITTDLQLQEQATPEIHQLIEQVTEVLQEDPFKGPWPFTESLQSAENNGYVRSAASIWGEDYDAVVYGSADELMAKVNHFLHNAEDREKRAESMRKTVLQRFTYVQTSARVLEAVRTQLERNAV